MAKVAKTQFKPFLFLLVSLYLLIAPSLTFSYEFAGKCTRVLDGDTIEVLFQSKAQRIRLSEIDCPETGKGKRASQPFSQTAKKFVLDVAAGQEIKVKVASTDRYGRQIAEVFLPDGRSLNRELVRNGLAWWYRQYSKDSSLGQIELEARKAKRGLWSTSTPIPPWEWRHKR